MEGDGWTCSSLRAPTLIHGCLDGFRPLAVCKYDRLTVRGQQANETCHGYFPYRRELRFALRCWPRDELFEMFGYVNSRTIEVMNMAYSTKSLEPVARADDRTPIAAKMEKRKRGPSKNDEPRREESRRASEANKGHKKTPV